MITRIRIQNFRSLVDVTVELDPLTVLIGRSGTGKSNFVNAVRFLRDCLSSRTTDPSSLGGRDAVLHPKHRKKAMTFAVTLAIKEVGTIDYALNIHPGGDVLSESLRVGDRELFHHDANKWVVEPKVTPPLRPGGILLGSIPGLEESSIAHVALRSGIGCYDFQGDVLQAEGKKNDPFDRGFGDRGDNYLAVAERLRTDLTKLRSWRRVVRGVRAVNRAATGLNLDTSAARRIDVDLQFGDTTLPMDVRQESEGFRRYLAHLFALYQNPSKQALLFEHPEAGLHPGALEALFEELKACPEDGRGQVILTTHSPQLLDYFHPDAIRVVDIEDQETRIDRLAPEQVEVVRDGLLRPGELLTVDPARRPGQLVEGPA